MLDIMWRLSCEFMKELGAFLFCFFFLCFVVAENEGQIRWERVDVHGRG